MDDKADVRLVDAETEGVGSDHDARVVAHERALRLLALVRGHAAVVHADLEPQPRQGAVERLDVAHRRAVDDARTLDAADEAQKAPHLLAQVLGEAHLERQGRAIEPGVDLVGLLEIELREDVLGDLGRRRGGERQHRRAAIGIRRRQRLLDRAQRQVRGAEIVAPLGRAMRFVDDEEADLLAAELLDQRARGGALGRDVDDLVAPFVDALERLALGLDALGGVEAGGHGAGATHLLHLVRHEREQRRDHDGDAGQLEGGELIRERLARAGRHDREHVAAGEQIADDRLLAGAEVA